MRATNLLVRHAFVLRDAIVTLNVYKPQLRSKEIDGLGDKIAEYRALRSVRVGMFPSCPTVDPFQKFAISQVRCSVIKFRTADNYLWTTL
jgi:hypothetical protein